MSKEVFITLQEYDEYLKLKDKAEKCERRNRMTFQELLKVLDDEMIFVVRDANTKREIDVEVGNSIIQRLEGEVKCISQLLYGAIVVEVDFTDIRGKEA